MEKLARSLIGFWSVFRWVLLAAAVIFAVWYIHRVLRRFAIDRLRYSRYFSEDFLAEGDATELVETVWNPTPFIILFVDFESYFYGELGIEGAETSESGMTMLTSRFHIMPFEKVTKRAAVKCKKRGFYKLTSVSVFRSGALRWIDAPAEISVCPVISEPTGDILSAYGTGDEISRKNLITNPFSVSGIREYMPGDSFRLINFKASARISTAGNPHFVVNKYDYCSNSRYYIYQNFHVPQHMGISYDEYENIMELGLRASASLVAKAIDSGGVCSFSANCKTLDGKTQVAFPLSGGEMHKTDILHAMAGIRAADGASFSSILFSDIASGVYNSEVFIVTAFTDESISEKITLFKRLGNSVRVILLGGDV